LKPGASGYFARFSRAWSHSKPVHFAIGAEGSFRAYVILAVLNAARSMRPENTPKYKALLAPLELHARLEED
ncbi:MAG: hypothetical protein ACKVG0_08640, partial [Alphaproteobacteria bacterium]